MCGKHPAQHAAPHAEQVLLPACLLTWRPHRLLGGSPCAGRTQRSPAALSARLPPPRRPPARACSAARPCGRRRCCRCCRCCQRQGWRPCAPLPPQTAGRGGTALPPRRGRRGGPQGRGGCGRAAQPPPQLHFCCPPSGLQGGTAGLPPHAPGQRSACQARWTPPAAPAEPAAPARPPRLATLRLAGRPCPRAAAAAPALLC